MKCFSRLLTGSVVVATLSSWIVAAAAADWIIAGTVFTPTGIISDGAIAISDKVRTAVGERLDAGCVRCNQGSGHHSSRVHRPPQPSHLERIAALGARPQVQQPI
jgi:hypothetical protein